MMILSALFRAFRKKSFTLCFAVAFGLVVARRGRRRESFSPLLASFCCTSSARCDIAHSTHPLQVEESHRYDTVGVDLNTIQFNSIQ
jgi:hypothetical protein